MDKVKQMMENNKKIVIIGSIVIVVALVGLGICLAMNNNKSVKGPKVLTEYLDEIGRDFYENFYYDQIGKDDQSRAAFVEKYKDIGFKFSIDNLSRWTTKDEAKDQKYAKMISEFKNNETGEECDKDKTMLILYPVSPYGKKNYTVEVELACGFDK